MAKPYSEGQFRTDKLLYAAYLNIQEAATAIELARKELSDIVITFSKQIQPSYDVKEEVQKAAGEIVQRHYLSGGERIENANIFEYNDNLAPLYTQWIATFQSNRPAVDLLNDGVHTVNMGLGERLDGELVAAMWISGDKGPHILVYDKISPFVPTQLREKANEYAIALALLLDEKLPKDIR